MGKTRRERHRKGLGSEQNSINYKKHRYVLLSCETKKIKMAMELRPKGKKPVGRSRARLMDQIKMDWISQ
jgi:hypothetical protein